jgi:hypothetical protein
MYSTVLIHMEQYYFIQTGLLGGKLMLTEGTVYWDYINANSA